MTKAVLGEVPVGISNRHIHLSQEHLEALFGPGYELTIKKDLSQTGQYAAEETLTIEGPKSALKNVRILGPVRKETQVEISRTDAFSLGLKPPVRDSGHLEDSPGIKLIGPKGTIELDKGVIIAQRHIHMNEADAEAFGVKDKEIVSVRAGGERGLVFDNVLVRVRSDFVLEMHIDTDEANAGMLNNGQMVEVFRD
ncbi:MAG TPA: phosphate propanoyltransferase [Firmicutes bacterium]|nr:phosphate propanoyltransferase [Bacillota bacterium]HHT42676.1 phosphate propanoyltransferase [Bacillota bacterium]